MITTVRLAAIIILCLTMEHGLWCQSVPAPLKSTSATLKYVVYLSRHGVRSPTKGADQYNSYSSSPWPDWRLPPGYLTAHGFQLMRIFGAYDRFQLTREGLLSATGCGDASHVVFYADSDQRTRESGKALAEGMFPDCAVTVNARQENDPDPLFHSLHAGVGSPDPSLALAAVEGRIGGNVNNLTEAYRPQLKALDHLLAGCGRAQVANLKRSSIFDVPITQKQAADDQVSDLRGPLTIASSMAESLLLEYTEGMKGAKLGWGCLDEDQLSEIMQLHAAQADFIERAPVIARMNGSNSLEHILDALEQSASGKVVPGALGKPDDRVLFLVGHDTNIASVAGLLDLHWIIDGRRDDTPPGGTLVFELWRSADGDWTVRLYYTAQTLRQMRAMTSLTSASPPDRVPVFVPGCGRSDMSCTLDSFASTVRAVIDPTYVRLELPEHAATPK